MSQAELAEARDDFAEMVRGTVRERLKGLASGRIEATLTASLMPGKMLRTKLGARLAAGAAHGVDRATLVQVCAATELLHTATLCHDDVIDNAMLRRGSPALWRAQGASAAIMAGDWLLCEAIRMVAEADGGRHVGAFVSKVRETCGAEFEHEVQLRGRALDAATCLRLARGKTGPLFAFVGQVCGGSDAAKTAALEEAGYCVGTAYQLADDLLDATGDEKKAGKTLGTDVARNKYTLAQCGEDGPALTAEHVRDQCRRAGEALASWPVQREGLEAFLRDDFPPILEMP